MNNIEKIYLLKREDLNQEYYFQSFLQQAYVLKLLTDSEFENIQLQSIQLLSKETERYTNGESSSVKVETAQNILQSIFYCIGTYLKSFPDTDLSVTTLKQKPLSELYHQGTNLIVLQFTSAKQLFESIQKHSLVTDNIAYNDTLQNGISAFFSDYDFDFATHESHGSIDYPLSHDKLDLVGVEYIFSYLQKISLENEFCLHFSGDDIHFLLQGYHENYKDLLINIFDFVLTNALGLLLAGKNPILLDISSLDLKYLEQELTNLSKDELEGVLLKAARSLCLKLNISNISLQNYISVAVVNLSARLKQALEMMQLDSIFISFKENHNKPDFQFTDGVAMEDELFRKLVEEIKACRFISDKIIIIQREVHSITDLADILEGYCIFGDEFSELYKSLGDMELALLLKKLPMDLEISNLHSTGNEEEWQNQLSDFLNKLDSTRCGQIKGLSKTINLD